MKLFQVSAVVLLASALSADTISTNEVEQSLSGLSTNKDGTVQAILTIPLKPGDSQQFKLVRLEPVVKGSMAVVPPLPLPTTEIHLVGHRRWKKDTNWQDFPPEFVVRPKETLPEGTRRQWGIISTRRWTETVLDGETNIVKEHISISTNFLTRKVKPVIEVTEPEPATSTNTTNF